MHSINRTHTASPNGEDSTCQNVKESSNSAEPILEALEPDQKLVFDLLRNTIGISRAGNAATSILYSLARDLRASVRHGYADKGWGLALSQLRNAIRSINGAEETLDKAAATGLRGATLKFLFQTPDPRYSTQVAEILCGLRGAYLLACLSGGEVPARATCDSLKKVFQGKTKEDRLFAEALVFDKDRLEILRDCYLAGTTFAKTLTALIDALNGPTNAPPRHKPISHSAVVPTPSEETGGPEPKPPTNVPPGVAKPKKKYSSVIAYHADKLRYAPPKKFSGIGNLYEFLQPFELESHFPTIVRDLNSEDRDLALAALLAYFFRCTPLRLHLLPFSEVDGNPLWLDLKNGQYCWILNSVTDYYQYASHFGESNTNQNRQIVRCSIAKQVIQCLRQKWNVRTNVRTAADLFDVDQKELHRRLRRYLRRISKTSHRLTVTRLENSRARFLLSLCRDESYAAALGMDFSLGTASNLNYVVLRAAAINDIAECELKALGFDGLVEALITKDVGSPFGARKDDVEKLFMHCIRTLHETYDSLPRRATFARICDVHDVIAKCVLTMLVVTSGSRAAAKYGFTMHTVDPLSRLALLNDKFVSEYLRYRLVPIPEIVAAYIKFYFSWLQSLFKRIFTLDRTAAAPILKILESADSEDPKEIFFSLSSGAVKPMGSADLAPLFQMHNLPTNVGRHWLAMVLQEAGCDSAVLMAMLGHACAGQESYGSSSALSPSIVFEHVNKAVGGELSRMDLRKPPKLAPSPYKRAREE